MSDMDDLVAQVKLLQRTNPEAKQAWWDMCDKDLDGIRDPKRHDEEILREFLSNWEHVDENVPVPSRTPSTVSRPSYGGHGRGGSGGGGGTSGEPPFADSNWRGSDSHEHGYDYASERSLPANGSLNPAGPNLGEFIKIGQRHSSAWRDCWKKYCQTYGQGWLDPSRYEEGFISGFIEWAGQLTEANLSVVAKPFRDIPPGLAKRLPPTVDSGPPMKRGRASGRSSHAAMEPHDALVDRVKALQRQSPALKQAWINFTSDHSAGVRDPARHDAQALMDFLIENE
eukprot:TRINITY_DN57205_c0_g1_i1.p1 TRINITY_DN57205_c0_g1~~TRINITY_DN57205_c0_g1_i1.p1  ORF type:complete len:284 (+),score=37.15 TRINITY_DN57205_c0_g1_i1:153-1004(+)